MAQSSSADAANVNHVDAQQAADLLKADPDIVVLDVRTGWEYRGGHLADAVNINYLSFAFSSKVAELDPDVTYLVHCKSGHRSARSLKILQEAGIKKLIHLDGGIDAWKSAGQTIIE